MNKIFIVEDDENIRELLLYALNLNEFEAFGFECGSDLLKDLKTQTPDIFILDIMLPDEDGISILKKLKENKTTTKIPIIMLTAKASEFDKIKGLDLGADDYVTKPFSVLELISRIKAVLRRSEKACERSKNVIIFKNIKLDIQKHTVVSSDKLIVLTFKEFELLKLLLQNIGIVLTRDKILDKVWGYDFEGGSRTVDMHIKTLRQKLDKSGEIIETIRGVGYKIGD